MGALATTLLLIGSSTRLGSGESGFVEFVFEAWSASVEIGESVDVGVGSYSRPVLVVMRRIGCRRRDQMAQSSATHRSQHDERRPSARAGSICDEPSQSRRVGSGPPTAGNGTKRSSG